MRKNINTMRDRRFKPLEEGSIELWYQLYLPYQKKVEDGSIIRYSAGRNFSEKTPLDIIVTNTNCILANPIRDIFYGVGQFTVQFFDTTHKYVKKILEFYEGQLDVKSFEDYFYDGKNQRLRSSLKNRLLDYYKKNKIKSSRITIPSEKGFYENETENIFFGIPRYYKLGYFGGFIEGIHSIDPLLNISRKDGKLEIKQKFDGLSDKDICSFISQNINWFKKHGLTERDLSFHLRE